MRVAIATVQVPFISGGAEIHARLLQENLVRRGHEADIITIPFKWYPEETLLDSLRMAALVDLTEVNGETIDAVIALKFPMYALRHPRKTVWLLHQHRQAYDLWGTPYGDLHTMAAGEAAREQIMAADNLALGAARHVYTNSETVSRRLRQFNGIPSTPLYHPPRHHARLHSRSYDDFIFYPSRVDAIKRQALLVQAAARMQSSMKIVMAGGGSRAEMKHVRGLMADLGVQERVELHDRLSEADLLDLYSRCRAVYFGGFHEDYGYVPLEGFFASKPVIVHDDAGGPLEFVRTGENGYVIPPEPDSLAAAMDSLSRDADMAERLGRRGRQDLLDRRMDWDHVIDSLLR
jgi:glycosyltransferase involved in cell wall biosynthesis